MALQIGDKAPDFTSKLHTGEDFQLIKQKSKYTILYFYPKDNTPGCTVQACGLRDSYEVITKLGTQIFGIGKGNSREHNKFVQNFNLNFPLILDEDLSISKLFDVAKEKSMFGKKYFGIVRTTYILDKDLRILHVMEKVNPITHSEKLLEILKEMK